MSNILHIKEWLILKIIKKMVKNMKKRLCLAECDIDLALKNKEEYPELAKLQYQLSIDLMVQFRQQHDQITQLIMNYKKSGGEIPEGMKAVYEYVHDEYMDWSAEIKAKQDMFK